MINRGPKPLNKTILILCARSGGRCQFNGCNKRVFSESLTKTTGNFSNVAHIIASSPEGPRGNEQSAQSSSDIDNLMLLCPEHHKLIDSDPATYTVEKLIAMKLAQEKEVCDLLDCMHYQKTEIVILEVPIKGQYYATVIYEQAKDAVLREGRRPSSEYGITLRFFPSGEYTSANYWQYAEENLTNNYYWRIQSMYDKHPNIHMSIFPIAPISIIAKLGNLLGDKLPVDIYQKNRQLDTWNWPTSAMMNTFNTTKTVMGDGNSVAVVLSLTAEVSLDRIREISNYDIIYVISSQHHGVDCIQSKNDLSAFWNEYIALLDSILNCDHVNVVDLFPAIPASAAFEIGRRHMPGIHPKVNIYDGEEHFFYTLSIGGEN